MSDYVPFVITCLLVVAFLAVTFAMADETKESRPAILSNKERK